MTWRNGARLCFINGYFSFLFLLYSTFPQHTSQALKLQRQRDLTESLYLQKAAVLSPGQRLGGSSQQKVDQTTSNVIVYDLSQSCLDSHKSVKTSRGYDICIHDPAIDVFISGDLNSSGEWEKALCDRVEQLLLSDPEMGLLDIGANIGVYTLLAASLGRPVVAVEGQPQHVQMLHHSLLLNNFTNTDVVLIQNLITDRRGDVEFYINPKNQGGSGVVPNRDMKSSTVYPSVFFDDITDHVHFKKAVLKLDIEDSEVMAFDHSDTLFTKVFIPFVLMEWRVGKSDPVGAVRLVDKLHNRGYQLFTTDYVKVTETNGFKFPADLLWKHESIEFPK